MTLGTPPEPSSEVRPIHARTEAAESALRSAGEHPGKATIFVLHRDQWIGDLLREFFSSQGSPVAVRSIAATAEIPLILATDQASTALLIVAKELRRVGGLEALHSAKQLGLTSMPVVYLSQNSWTTDEAQAREAGADWVLEFPTIASEVPALTTRIQSLLGCIGPHHHDHG